CQNGHSFPPGTF
nr:immunoglobulin light chain junction region [Mus musculus]